ncbi:zinc ABC transporter substrate-binding protein [Shimia sp. Alg240-R146]|uniref:zinc ABC transporter substrate-binding protein n=1 Tax=Shimia sp. Alg240-R146 TaxID=2993449 RepID=UPI0022E234CD|nr:zinc ABC transporter substrate-binding protein [Shimia sp. Alg240-R146]
MKLLPVSFVAFLGATLSVQAETPRVVADIAPVHSLVAQVMEGVGTPDLLMQPTASPHGYALRPSEARALQNANLVFWIGHELTPQLEGLLESLADEAHVVELLNSADTVRHNFRTSEDFKITSEEDHEHGHDDHDEHSDHDDHEDHDDHADDDHAEHGHDDHENNDHAEHDDHGHEGEAKHEDHDDHAHDDHEGHDHDGTDVHAWLDPHNARVWLSLIADELSEVDPANAATYAKNAAAAQAELDALEEEIAAKLISVADANFVVFHDAYQYFETRFGLIASGAIRVGDGSSASAARLREVRNTLTENKVECIFSEPQFPDSLVASVAEGLDIHTAELDPLGANQDVGADLYNLVIGQMSDDFVSCLKHDDH